jgi:hypothetical protein
MTITFGRPLDLAGAWEEGHRAFEAKLPRMTFRLEDVEREAFMLGWFEAKSESNQKRRQCEAYWDCDIWGGCADCHRLAAEVGDERQFTTWREEIRDHGRPGSV